MGKYFKMSRRFDKRTPQDFGLTERSENGDAIDPEDGSQWHSCTLYDYGWGSENGFYRIPLPEFSALLGIVLDSNDQDDVYGAASVILELFPNDLLESLEHIYSCTGGNERKRKLATVFQLHLGINRSHTQGKHYSEIISDAHRWSVIGEITKQLE